MNRSDGVTVADLPLGSWITNIAAGICGQVCDASDDHWHHADEHDYIKVSEGKDGTYAVRAKCKYCHKEFVASGLTADSLSDAYTDYVSTLPAQGYDSAGTLLWQPRWSDTLSSNMTLCADVRGSYSTSKSTELYSFASNLPASSAFSFSYPLDETNPVYISLHNVASHFFRAPISGKYTCLNTSIVSAASYRFEDGTIESQKRQWSYAQFSKAVSAGSSVGIYNNSGRQLCSALDIIQCSMTLYTPVYVVEPYDTDMVTNNYYINTRVNNFNGDYYDSVTNNYYNNTTINNETTNNYYDMTTNTTYVMQKWSYDYQSRTYFITLEDGTTVTVQFGDDCMTITNNNVTNSYQYVIKNNGTPDTPTTCKHEWTETIDTAPTCLEGGHASYTCSKCGETYEQILAAKGHDWKVIEHVNMVYNSDGTVATQGHTLYQCSVCGEQWYTDTGAPPPDVSGSSNILAWLQEFKIWLGDKLDNLFSGSGSNNFWTSTKDTVADVLSSLLEALLGFITDILGAILDLVKELLSFFFDLLSSVVISGISGFFSGLKDPRLFDFAQKGEDGSVTALPDGVAAVFAFFSGVLLALPVELRSLLFFGTALVVLIGVINIIKS